MPPYPPQNRESVAYWAIFAFTAAIWVFCASIAGAMLVMSLTGRIRAGVWSRMLISLYALAFVAWVSAHTIAFWMARDLPEDVNLTVLRRKRRPDDEVASRVWWWMRASWYGGLAAAGFFGLLVVLGLSGAFAEETPRG